MLDIEKIREGVHTVVSEYPIKKVELFGSYAEGTNNEKSDIDLLVEFVTPTVSLLTLNALKYRLEEIYNISVDVVHGPIDKNTLISIGKVVSLYKS